MACVFRRAKQKCMEGNNAWISKNRDFLACLFNLITDPTDYALPCVARVIVITGLIGGISGGREGQPTNIRNLVNAKIVNIS